ncbi:MAG: SusC/RagA family TonB-linked outer membrane protein [Bacteroidota bacterium]
MIKIYLSLVMKTIMCLLLTGFMTVSAASYSQQITLKGNRIPFSTVIDAIRSQSGYAVFGTKKLLESAKPVTIDVKSMDLAQFLAAVTQGQEMNFVIEDKTISLSAAPVAKINPTPSPVSSMRESTLTGIVRHAQTREAMAGVTVRVKATEVRTQTDEKGRFTLTIPTTSTKQVIVFSYVGMKTLELNYQKQGTLDVEMEPDETSMGEIVVTGIYQRNREVYTGSSSVFKGKDLLVVGNQNILQSLKTLDPSFAIVENNTFGSDPNRMPDVEIRGKSSVIGLTEQFASNPNQPLFILDGFESTLRIIADLSMNRVESITLLKDASATAIYGSKAANGVVVVETKRPAAGELRVNYNMDGSVGFADLSDYNLMNAREKLEFELLSNFYGLRDATGQLLLGSNPQSEINYNNRLKEVNRGVDTYWPSEPLRTAFTQKHTLFAEGGDANLRYGTSFNYGLTKGVMDGSDRQATAGNIRLLYRKGKISVNNNLSIDQVIANRQSTEFSEFSRANPYYRKYDDLGNVRKVLEDFKALGNNAFTPIYSPLYDQSNLNIDQEKTFSFTNNFELEWRILESLRARGRLGIGSNTAGNILFRSPFDVEFESTDVLRKGRYTEGNGKSTRFDSDFSLTFGKLYAEKHMLNAVAGMRAEQITAKQSNFQVSGFTDDEFSNPNFALGYVAGEKAGYQESKRRAASFFTNVGYAYDQRFLIDATLRSDGSSVYGADKQFSVIWSVGLGWNIHNEHFIKDGNFKWINQLRLRGSIGNPGNQNFDDYISTRIYRYNNDNRNPFGTSTIISNMGNRNLQWQTTLDRNIGLDLTAFSSRLRVTADYFNKDTDPLLVFINLPSSVGVGQVAQNVGGQITKGFTLSSDYAIIKTGDFNWRVNLNLRRLRTHYHDMGNQLSNYNTTNKSRNLIRYYDGGSPSDLWAVRSAGIDPATGREIFLNLNGEQTFVHNYQDEVIVGNSDPDLEGVIGTNLFYKGFSASLNLRYRIGGQAFMQTLYEKVENISTQGVTLNQDKRALYDRWKKPGDLANFKAISTTDLTPMSSRFVADNNMLIGEAFSVGYENSTATWLKTVRASSITLRAYMNDIFHLSTIKNERGLDYPFARSVSFSAGLRF